MDYLLSCGVWIFSSPDLTADLARYFLLGLDDRHRDLPGIFFPDAVILEGLGLLLS
jgi:hypothetical protein